MKIRQAIQPFGPRYFTEFIVFLLLLMMAFACAKAHASTDEVEAILSKIRPIENTNLNDIQILDNRFRIDDDVEEVTLIFFRAKGSPPIVLVRPDGSKFHLDNDSTNDDYTWHETDTYDMISLARPMPGPWQAVGKILPESRLIVIANINLKIDPLPKTIFQGESIKLTAQLENAGSHVELVEFRDVVALSLEFSSSNNPNYDNFGLGTRTIARFEDDGMGFDERARDKIFTGQFLANVTAGEWQPIASVRTPLLSREKRLPNVIVEKAPVTVSHVAEAGTDGYHTITVEGDEQWIDVKSVLIDGTVRQPNGDTQRIAFTEITDGPKVIDTLNVGYGVYAIHLSVFARSVDGRDLVINLPRYSFTTEPPPAPPEEAVAEEVAVDMVLPPEEEAPNYVLLVLAINLCILLISALIIFTIIDKRKHGSNLWFKRLWSGMLALLPKKKVVEAPAAAE